MSARRHRPHNRARSVIGLLTGAFAVSMLTMIPQSALAAGPKDPRVLTDARTGKVLTEAATGAPIKRLRNERITSATFEKARQKSRAEVDAPDDVKLKSKFLQNAADVNRNFYTPSEIEVVKIDDQVAIVGPTDLKVGSIEVSVDAATESVSAYTDVTAGDIDASAPSPGFGWTVKGSGQYNLVVSNWGTGVFLWEKDVLTGGDDGDPRKDYWTYIT